MLTANPRPVSGLLRDGVTVQEVLQALHAAGDLDPWFQDLVNKGAYDVVVVPRARALGWRPWTEADERRLQSTHDLVLQANKLLARGVTGLGRVLLGAPTNLQAEPDDAEEA